MAALSWQISLLVCLCFNLLMPCTMSGLNVAIPEDHLLHQSLHHFDVLHRDRLVHGNMVDGHRSLVLSTLNKTFHMRLFPRQGLFEPGVGISIVSENGSTRQHTLDPTHFYEGELVGWEGSRITAHLDHREGILTASIYTQEEHYFIEPSHRHFRQSHDFHMISYRKSDIKNTFESQHHCATTGPAVTASSATPTLPVPTILSVPSTSSATPTFPQVPYLVLDRHRRQAKPTDPNSCPMVLVGSTSFYRAYSPSGDVDTTIFFMVQVIDDINQGIFRQVQWNERLTNYGLTIKNVTVFESSAGSPAYNQEEGVSRLAGEVLQLFSHHDWSDFCLAHLFTFETFSDNRVGVAYEASPSTAQLGGICSPNFMDQNQLSTGNVALSSFRGDSGRVLLLGEGRLITAHEIGHNWGGAHDPTTPGPCNPPLSQDQGKFLMYPFRTDGTQQNNDQFSACSEAAIARVLLAKSTCFTAEPSLVCGNYRVEDGEECDGGLPGMLNSDPCCTAECKLRPGMNCSDINNDCCTNCQIAPPTKVCRSFMPGNGQCLDDVSCDGIGKVCPSAQEFVAVNTTCLERGLCLPSGTKCTDNGECNLSGSSSLQCYGVCLQHNRRPCFCPDENECNVCCLQVSSSNSSLCVPFTPIVPLPRGSSCVGGVCEEGRCKLISPGLIQRLFSLFTDISFNRFIIFFSENIVGTVLILSILLWIGPSLLIHCCCDVKRLKKIKEQLKYLEEEHQGNVQENLLDLGLIEDQYPAEKKIALTRGLSSLPFSLDSRPSYHSLMSEEGLPKTKCSVRHGYKSRPPPISRLQSQQSRISVPDWEDFKYDANS